MTTIETNGRTLVVVEVLFNSFDFTITEANFLWWRFITTHNWDEDNKVELPAGCKIIGLLSELTAEQCEPYAPTDDVLKEVNAKEKFILLLAIPYCLDTQKPLLIIEKLK